MHHRNANRDTTVTVVHWCCRYVAAVMGLWRKVVFFMMSHVLLFYPMSHVSKAVAQTNQIDGRTLRDSAISHVPLTFRPELALPSPNQLILAMRYCNFPSWGWYLQSRMAEAWVKVSVIFSCPKCFSSSSIFRSLPVWVEFRFHDDKHNLSCGPRAAVAGRDLAILPRLPEEIVYFSIRSPTRKPGHPHK